jgi:hypothetical protein
MVTAHGTFEMTRSALDDALHRLELLALRRYLLFSLFVLEPAGNV